MLSLSTSEASSCVVNLVSAMVLVWSCLCQIDHSLLLNTLPLIFASVKPAFLLLNGVFACYAGKVAHSSLIWHVQPKWTDRALTCCGGVGCDAGHTIVMVWLHPTSATTPFGELLLAPLLISLMHSSSS